MIDKKISREVTEEIYWQAREGNSTRLSYIAIIAAAIDDEFLLACERGAFEGSGLDIAKDEVVKETVRAVLSLTDEQIVTSISNAEAKLKDRKQDEEADLEEAREETRARRWSQS